LELDDLDGVVVPVLPVVVPVVVPLVPVVSVPDAVVIALNDVAVTDA
jgi:hypothetical protein